MDIAVGLIGALGVLLALVVYEGIAGIGRRFPGLGIGWPTISEMAWNRDLVTGQPVRSEPPWAAPVLRLAIIGAVLLLADFLVAHFYARCVVPLLSCF